MLHFMKKLLLFRVGQKATKGFAKSLGFRGLALPIGLIGGFKYMRRH